MAIEERDAFQLFQTLETLPEDMRPRAAGVLADYRNQQTAAGLPLWPSQEAARADERKRVYEVFDNPLTLDKEDGSFIQADRVQPGLGDTLRKREASIMWLANRYGADEMDVRNRLDLYKADASQKWGAGLLDDSAFFSRAKTEIDAERKKADDVKLASMTGIESSLWGGDGFAEASKFQASKPDASPDEQDAFWRSFNEFNAVLEPRRDMVKKATGAMRRMQQGEDSDADKATMEELTWAMTEATGKEREIMKRAVVLGARKVAEEGKRGVGGTFTGSASNLIESMFGGARRGEQLAREFDPTQPQPVGPVKTVQDALKAMDTMARAQFSEQVPYDPDAPALPEARVLTPEEQKLFTEAKAKVKDLFKVERELKKIALMTDPMDDSVLGTMASGTASTLTLALPLAMGPQGILMAAGGYANMEKEELLTEYPDMQPEDARKVAVLSGGLQAVMDKAQLFGLGKFAPNVRKMLTEGMTRELVKRAIAQGGATFAFENIVEAAQDLTTPVVQQLVSDLSESVPGVDWQKEFEEFAGSRLDVAIGMLPLMLIGAGANTAMDRDSVLALLADDKALAEAGFIQDDRVAILDLARKGKAEDAQARLQDAMSRRSPELAAEMGNEKEADIINAEKVLQKAIEDGILPRARKAERGADGWIVEDTITGDVVKVPTREEAIKLTFGHLDDQEQRRAQAGAQLWDELYEKGGMGDESLRAESASMDTQKQAARSPEDAARVARAIETYAQLHGIPLDEARKIVFTVNGFNRDEQIENVRTAVSSVFGRGMNVSTVLHETTHGRWRAGLESGRFSHGQGLAWVRLAENATGIDFLPSKDDAKISEDMLDEAIVDVTVSDAIGRRKDGSKFSAGLISRGMAAMARGERNSMLGKDIDSRKASRAAGTFATWLKAWKEFWGQVIQKGKALRKAKAEGKLGEDYEAFLDELMEASPQRRHEAAAAKEALEIAQAGNMAFSLTPKGQDAEYLAAVESGDLAKAQEMADAAAKKAGGEILFRSGGEFLNNDGFLFLAQDEEYAANFGEDVGRFYAFPKNTLDLTEWDAEDDISHREFISALQERGVDTSSLDSNSGEMLQQISQRTEPKGTLAKAISAAGFDSIRINEYVYGGGKNETLAMLDDNLVQSADPVTRDDNGNVIPLSQRFNPETPDIRFSLAPRSLPDEEFDQLSEKEQDAVLRSDDVANARSVLHRGMSLPKNDQYTHLTFDDEPSKSSKSDSLYYFVKAWLTDNETSRLFKKDDDGFLEYDYQLEEAGYQIDDDGVYKGLEIRISDHPSTSSARTDADIDLIVDDSRASRPSWYQKHPDAYRSFSAAAFDIPKRVAEKLRIKAESPSFSLAPRSLPEVADTILAAQMKKPAFFEAFVTLARRKMDKLRKQSNMRARPAYVDQSAEIQAEIEAARVDYEADVAQLRQDRDFELAGVRQEKSGKLSQEQIRRDFDGKIAQRQKDWTRQKSALDAKLAANDAAIDKDAARAEKDRQMMALRTLDAILSAFPPEIRAKVGGFVKLAEHGSDAAREAEITRRLAKLEEVIEEEAKKHYAAKIEKLFKRFAPKKEAGKKATGQLDPDAQELVDAARAAMGYDDTRTRAELAAIDSMLAEDGLTAEREIQLERQRELVQLFGDFDNAESTRMESAADALEDTATEGWAKWKLKKIMERERRTEARQALIADTGKPSIGKERDKQNKWAKTKFGKAFSALLNVSSFSELLRFEFGEKSETARSLEDQERAAAYAYEDAMQAFGDRVGDFFAELAGGRLAGEQLRFDLAQPTLTVGTGDNERTISQLQGIQALLMWQQEDGRRHMEGSFDENGKPSGKWHYGEEWIADLESKLSPEAYQVKSFLEGLYGEEYQPLNAVYRQRHGVNLPKNERYSPITVQPMQAKAGEMVDPVSGFAVTGSILTPGGLRTRNKRAVAEPRFDDAVQIFLGHSRQMEHWKAYYDFATDAQAILLNREVTNAVEAKGSTQAVTVLKKWVDQFAQGGSRDAQSGLEISSVYSRASGRAARVALLGRISTILIQSTQLAAASVKMPVGSYLKRLGMLLSGNLDYTAAVNSLFIQRRYKTAPPIVQQALAGVGDANRPSALSSTTPRILGNLLSGADALFTGGTYAIILDYHRSVTGPAMGLQGAELEAFAQAEAERDTEAVAQPVRAGTRSIFENTLTSPLAKTGFAFASEARQKIALAAWAASRAKTDPAQSAKVAFLTFIVGGLVTQVLKNLWREAKDDDDEKMWSAERLVKATIAGPLHGVPGVSELMGDPGLFSGFKWSSEAVKKIATKAMDDDLDEVTMRDVENALSAAGYFNDTAAGIAGLSHLGFDFAKILQALAEED